MARFRRNCRPAPVKSAPWWCPPDYRAQGRGNARRVPEQALVFTDDGVLHVQNDPKGTSGPVTTFVRPESLLYMRSSHVLLYGRLELVSAQGGEPSKLEMEFSGIGWRLMETEWRAMVAKVIAVPVPDYDIEQMQKAMAEKLVLTLPPKFADGLPRYGLYTGETLIDTVFQPAIWDQKWSVVKRQITPNTLLALTEASVLLIGEDRALVKKSQQYGLTITRIPRKAIAEVRSEAHEHLHELIFVLTRDGATAERRIMLEPETVKAWMDLWNK
ncbi:MAG: hypothetical protein IPK16_22085 [Anaerolineales bacterium]|nr:hypothetical protein [Anaerolineales bacterium]